MLKSIRKCSIIVFLIGFISLLYCCDENDDEDRAMPVYFISKYLKYQTTFLVNQPKFFEGPYPVLYLLNGYGADACSWGSGADLQGAADENGALIVSATAGSNWYVDVPSDSSKWFMSYILEIVNYVDSSFNTIPDRNHRSICGISNGGRGAIYIASQHPEKFISASALSAAYYTGYIPDYNAFRDVALLFEIGTDDALLSECRWLHDRLLERSIFHEYNEFSGGHNWKFWRKRYQYHFRFHFDKIVD